MNSSRQNQYKEVEPLTENPAGPMLVRNIETGEFWVRKRYPKSLEKNLRKLMAIHHKHIAKIENLEISEEDILLYEEYIHGKSLSNLLQSNEQLSANMILSIASAVLEGLNVLHQSGLIHRDIKPANIMISNDERVKLIDFDAVRQFDGQKENDTVQLGTVGFASPEQFGFAESDNRSDLYSLGVVINVCSVREYPQKQLTEEPLLKDIVIRATKIDSADRYQSAAEMQTAVQSQLGKTSAAFERTQIRNSPQWTPNNAALPTEKQEILHRVTKEDVQKNEPLQQENRQSRFSDKIPKSPSKNKGKRIATAAFYVLLILLAISGKPGDITTKEHIIWVFDLIFVILLPFLFLTNLNFFRSNIQLFASSSPFKRAFGYFLLGLVWFLIVGVYSSLIR